MLTITRVSNPTSVGDKRGLYADVTFDSSYEAGGEDVSLAALGFSLRVDLVLVSQAAGVTVEPVYASDGSVKLKAVRPTAAHSHTENTAAAYTQNAATNANVTANASEVAAATDLSAVTVRCLFLGA